MLRPTILDIISVNGGNHDPGSVPEFLHGISAYPAWARTRPNASGGLPVAMLRKVHAAGLADFAHVIMVAWPETSILPHCLGSPCLFADRHSLFSRIIRAVSS